MTWLDLLAEHPALLYAVTGLFALAVGSFLNVVIHRLPRMIEQAWREDCREATGAATETAPAPRLNLATPGSRCPHCGHAITALENIPILSYLLLRGRCSACSAPIGLRYPLVEAATALLSVLVVWRFGVGWEAGAALILTWGLVALAVIDFDTQLLPDAITLPLLWLGLLLSLGGWFTDSHSAILGAAFGYLSLWLVFHGFRLLTGKEGMGFGDFKLFALLGAWLGWQHLPQIILISAVAGAVIGVLLILTRGHDRQVPIPFGPYLAIAGWISLMWGEAINQAYLRWTGLG
ncbi:MAG: A24 family peptidase [Chromatiaceae bacterium]|jgi:leader peptidase (prepilin peptidase)/N-methyltransferase|nr:A24 family peptidase [Chromatiaceae bacterium]